MGQPELDAEQLRREIVELQQRAAELLNNLNVAGAAQVGGAAREAVYREDKLTLYRYQRLEAATSNGPAVLICYALVNRPYMLDLQPDRSLIRGLLQRGMDVFLIDWGYPDGADRYLELGDYVNRYLGNCAAKVCELRDEAQVNLLGVCQGGTLSLCFTALHSQRVKNLITMVTPVDFQTPDDLLSKWARHIDVDALVAASGNISGDFLNAVFVSLSPFRLLSQKYIALLDIANDQARLENFMRMEKWIFDSPDQPGKMFAQFVRSCYQQNQLIKNELKIDDKAVTLASITQPLLNIYATQDHLVPPAASRCLQQHVSSADYSELEFPSGHIGIYVSSKAQQVPAAIAQWLWQRR